MVIVEKAFQAKAEDTAVNVPQIPQFLAGSLPMSLK